MLRKGLPLIAAVGLLVASPPGARADLCFCYGTGGGILVAKGATLPANNTCEALPLFEVGGLGDAATGSICTDRGGATHLPLRVSDLPPPATKWQPAAHDRHRNFDPATSPRRDRDPYGMQVQDDMRPQDFGCARELPGVCTKRQGFSHKLGR